MIYQWLNPAPEPMADGARGAEVKPRGATPRYGAKPRGATALYAVHGRWPSASKRLWLPSSLLQSFDATGRFFVRSTMQMRHFITIQLVIVGLFLVGCRSPQVAFRDMDPKPTASVSGGTLMVHLGVVTNIPVSEVWIAHKAKIVGQTVSVSSYRSFYHEQSREFSIQLPATVATQTVSVVWIDPDGSKVSVPITK